MKLGIHLTTDIDFYVPLLLTEIDNEKITLVEFDEENNNVNVSISEALTEAESISLTTTIKAHNGYDEALSILNTDGEVDVPFHSTAIKLQESQTGIKVVTRIAEDYTDGYYLVCKISSFDVALTALWEAVDEYLQDHFKCNCSYAREKLSIMVANGNTKALENDAWTQSVMAHYRTQQELLLNGLDYSTDFSSFGYEPYGILEILSTA